MNRAKCSLGNGKKKLSPSKKTGGAHKKNRKARRKEEQEHGTPMSIRDESHCEYICTRQSTSLAFPAEGYVALSVVTIGVFSS